MKKKDLVLHLPVIHKGYLDFFKQNKKNIDKIYILDESFLNLLSKIKPDIASINSIEAKNILEKIGFGNINILKKGDLKKLGPSILLVNDEISRTLKEKFLNKKKVSWGEVFLRWDAASVLSSQITGSNISKKAFDKKMMKEAYFEAESSSDWWRQVGAVLVKNKKILLRAYNKGVPTDHTPYQVGAVRDFLEVGQHPELSSTIHAEQVIVAEAAKKGLRLEGLSLYVTHFPCSVCSKLIAHSGIKKCYFGQGSSNIDGKTTLESHGVEILVVQNSHTKA